MNSTPAIGEIGSSILLPVSIGDAMFIADGLDAGGAE